jgi:hypothetical protein
MYPLYYCVTFLQWFIQDIWLCTSASRSCHCTVNVTMSLTWLVLHLFLQILPASCYQSRSSAKCGIFAIKHACNSLFVCHVLSQVNACNFYSIFKRIMIWHVLLKYAVSLLKIMAKENTLLLCTESSKECAHELPHICLPAYKSSESSNRFLWNFVSVRFTRAACNVRGN